MKVQWGEPERKAGDVAVVKKVILAVFILSAFLISQELPVNELQVNINGYFDNFGVNILYPTVSVNKQISDKTSINARYLVDVISAASMKTIFRVDGVSSATQNLHGGGDSNPDEMRHEFGGGVTHLLGDILLSLNGIYSTEHDYTSKTIAANVSVPFAKKNTVLNFGVVRSWDVVSPQTRFWEKDKNVISLNAGLSQIIGKGWITQINMFYSRNEGFLSDAYQVVSFINRDRVVYYSPVYPDNRDRRALGVRSSYSLDSKSSIQFGYRYYWDTWDVKSHTFNALYQRHLNDEITLSFGARFYNQTKAYFFKENYSVPEELMAVDAKLNASASQEIELKLNVKGDVLAELPFLKNFFSPATDLSASLNFYIRQTPSPDWFSRRKTLYAYILSIGYRYRF